MTAAGYDTYRRRIVFPLEGNLYGRSLSAAAPPHRFLPGAKGGLYSWDQVRLYPEVILVEGLFDYAVLWQAGFHNVTCSLGTNLNARQFRQLCDGPRTVYLAFDADTNGSGQQAAQSLAGRLTEQGVNVRTVALPDGHDPNSFFVRGRRCASVSVAAGGGAVMTFRVVHKPSNNHVHDARIALSSRPPAVRLTGSTGTSTTKCSAAWPTPPCELMRTSCCTFSGGGRVFTTPTWSPKMPSPNRHCWTMCDSSPARNAS